MKTAFKLTVLTFLFGFMAPTAMSDEPPGIGFEDEFHYSGKIYDGREAVASLSLDLNERLQIVGGSASSAFKLQAFSGAPMAEEQTASVGTGAKGEITLEGFPFGSDDKSVLRFDARGKPAKDAKKLSGTITTPGGKTLKFELVLSR